MEERRGALRAPVNWHSPLFGPLAADREAESELLERLFRQPHASIKLNVLTGGREGLAPFIAAAREQQRLVLSRTILRSPFIDLRGSFADYERGLSRNRRRSLGSGRRRLDRSGTVRFEVHDGSERLDELLDELLQVESSGWKGRSGTAIASRPETRRFYTEIARWAAERGWLRLAFLRLGDRAVACDYALEHNGVWYTLKAGYDEQLSSVGPGAILLREEIAHCFRSGLSRIELLGSEDPFKLSWTDRRAERTWLAAFRRDPTGLAGWSLTGARQAARAARARASRA
jgi:CelD/BcsL family acetyltransferase involved in cellulose biosynthesis